MLREFLIHPYNDEIPCCSSIQLWQSNMLRITKSTWDFSFFLFSDLNTLRSFFTFRQLFSAFGSFAFRYHCFQSRLPFLWAISFFPSSVLSFPFSFSWVFPKMLACLHFSLAKTNLEGLHHFLCMFVIFLRIFTLVTFGEIFLNVLAH